MLFRVSPEIFDLFPDYMVGVVVARQIDNTRPVPPEVLEQACERARSLVGHAPKQHPMVSIWRDAFARAGYNPNRFPPSIDALTGRVAKSGGLPSINPAVDVINAHSLTHLLPMGAHDIGLLHGDFEVRKSGPVEVFTPMGGGLREAVEQGEIVYADASEVRTRRWIWRQGDKAKVTSSTLLLFCPIDGFAATNPQQVVAARTSLAQALPRYLGGTTQEFLVDKDHPSVAIA